MGVALKTIGWIETIELVTLDLQVLRAKVDTGAKTSVLHCTAIEDFNEKGTHYVRFVPFGHQHGATGNQKSYVMPCKKRTKIKNSFGQEEYRFVVSILVRLFGKEYHMDVSLRDRSKMEFAMLIGRNFIRGKFLVDVSRADLSIKSTNRSN